MSQDIVRSNSPGNNPPGGLVPTQQDAWLQQQALAVATPQANQEVQPLQLIHRSLRGRYLYATVAALIGAILGAAVGWTSYSKSYTAGGLIKIMPYFRVAGGPLETTPQYEAQMNTLAAELRGDLRLAERAMASTHWQKLVEDGIVRPNASAGFFLSRVRSEYNTRQFFIRITYNGSDPRLAVGGANAVVEAFKELQQGRTGDTFRREFEDLNKAIERDELTINRNTARIDTLMADRATRDLSHRISQLTRRFSDAAESYERAALLLENMKATRATPQPLDPRLLQQFDPSVADDARMLRDLERKLALDLASGIGENNPNIIRLKSQIATLRESISGAVGAGGGAIYGIILDRDAREVVVTDERIRLQEQLVRDLNEETEKRGRELKTDEDLDYQVATLREQNTRLEKEILKNREKAERAEQLLLTSPESIETSAAQAAQVAEDKRPTMAMFGAVVGAGLPLLAFFLRGLTDKRVRYSDEAAGRSGNNVPMLGVLPNLPDRLSDPSQASVAAHCVHQIRTMLQLNVLDDGPSVITITSATSGDGKTSLSLALGLSFAAAGSRTLLVDADLVGAGLSARLGIREPQGVNEAVTARDPMAYVRETDVADLCILPVGIEGTQQASHFSPSATRRLIAELRRNFDVVIIDTGPVLGSIEATPIIAASDATIITVARGQDRTMVDKAITHIRTIGGRLAGFVFNRASTPDFEKTISGISLRTVSRAVSRPGQNRPMDPTPDPLAQSVHESKP